MAVSVSLTTQEKTTYRRFRQELLLRIGDGEVRGDTAVKEVMKLRQMAAGIVRDEEGAWRRINKSGLASKTKAFLQVLDDESGLDGQRSVIGVVQFRKEAEMVQEAVRKSGRWCEILYGGLTSNEKDARVHEFRRRKGAVLLLHPRTAGHGVTLTSAATMVFLSLPYSQEDHLQVRGRIHRIGQERPCRYVYLLAEGTLDSRIRKLLLTRERSAERFLEAFCNE